jgi:hypothetical protein
VDGYGKISFGTRSDFRWGDLKDAMDIHDRWRSELEKDGLLAQYISMGDQLHAALVTGADSRPPGPEDALETDMKFDAGSFAVTAVTATCGLTSNAQPHVTEPGHVHYSVRVFHALSPRRTRPIDHAIENVWWNVMRRVIESRYPDPDL